MAVKLQANECLVKIPGRDKPLRTLTSAVEAGKYGEDFEIIARGAPAKTEDAASDTEQADGGNAPAAPETKAGTAAKKGS